MRYIALVLFVALLPCVSYAVAPVTGTLTLCQSGTTALSDITPGGAWTSDNTSIATVNSIGIVTGVAAGTAIISYTDVSGSAMATVTVDPLPVFVSTLTPPAICDSNTFNYAPTSATFGVTYAWSRAYVAGIVEVAGAGADNPNEQLMNTTFSPIAVAYVYTLTAGSCINTQTVTVTVNPAIRLSSLLSADICSGELFNYVPTSLTPGASYAWTRKAVTGISLAAASGSGNISETLTDTATSPVIISYKFKLTANGCTAISAEYVSVTVHPQPCGTAGVSQNNEIEGGVFPNPNTGEFSLYISGPIKEPLVISITNLVGGQIKNLVTETNTSTNISLDVPSGLYILCASTVHGQHFSKFVVAR